MRFIYRVWTRLYDVFVSHCVHYYTLIYIYIIICICIRTSVFYEFKLKIVRRDSYIYYNIIFYRLPGCCHRDRFDEMPFAAARQR